jgi:hypothetical protein
MWKSRRIVVWALLAVFIAAGAATVVRKQSILTPAWAADNCKENCK